MFLYQCLSQSTSVALDSVLASKVQEMIGKIQDKISLFPAVF